MVKTRSVAVLSTVRGRARLRVAGLRRQPALGFHLRESLAADGRVSAVRASAVTGNVLVRYDADRLPVAELRRLIGGVAATYRPLPGHGTAALAPGPARPDAGHAWHTRTVAEVVQLLSSTPAAGLATKDADERLARTGPNRLLSRQR